MSREVVDRALQRLAAVRKRLLETFPEAPSKRQVTSGELMQLYNRGSEAERGALVEAVGFDELVRAYEEVNSGRKHK